MIDRFSRKIDYMRISITDRCNLRCRYCMPYQISSVSHDEILRYEEILEICQAAVSLGITNFKITGGEPLVRKGCLDLIRKLKCTEGVHSVTLTTNGVLLKSAVPVLKDSGIDAVNVSLDTTDAKTFQELTGFDQYDAVMEGIRTCLHAGIHTKLNCVLLEGQEDQILKLAALAQKDPIDVRFIELMPIGYGKDGNGISWKKARSILTEIYPDLHPMADDMNLHRRAGDNGPADYEQSDRLLGRIGWIHAVSHKFCDQCNRIRLTSTGLLKPCLCYGSGIDLKKTLRNSEQSDRQRLEILRQDMIQAMEEKPEGHCFGDRKEISEKKQMSQIGG